MQTYTEPRSLTTPRSEPQRGQGGILRESRSVYCHMSLTSSISISRRLVKRCDASAVTDRPHHEASREQRTHDQRPPLVKEIGEERHHLSALAPICSSIQSRNAGQSEGRTNRASMPSTVVR